MFANSLYETSTDTEKAFNKAFAAQLGNIALIVALVVGAAFVDHPDDRRQHHGDGGARAHARDRRAQDAGLFRRRASCAWCSGELVLLALLGGLPGIALAALFAAAMETSVGNFVPGFAVTPGIALTAVALMLVLGLATG